MFSKRQKYCTCEICPHLSGREFGSYCSYYEAQVISPSKTWCSVGITSMWMEAHKPKEVVEFLAAL